jgi:outer membrane protein OmpA-like peptidoglycan-associated protein
MKRIFSILIIAISFLTLNYTSFSQEILKGFGLGLSFHAAVAKTDVGGYEPRPITRMFARYHVLKNFAIETGFGFGMLEGNKIGFFSSKIVPIDVRFVFYPKSSGKVLPLLFGGFSFMNFNPVDINDKPLPNNAQGRYSHWMAVLPIGGGFQYFITSNSIIEFVGTYSVGTKDYLDDTEMKKNNDGYYSFGFNVYAFIESGDADPDKDGLTNNEEKELGTDPNNPDTDGDGLKDGAEVKTYRTNPLNPDTDSDGLKDGEEVLTYRTNPLNPDTDGDGLKDGEEVLNYRTDPLNPDTDGDGLKDGEEVLKYKTDPLKPDTDGDGLTDGDEVLKYSTDPLKLDTDGDGLTDSEEVLTFHTHPLLVDTDNGGVADGKEVARGTDPLNPDDDRPVMQVGEKIILQGINFESGKATLLPSSVDTLNAVAIGLLANPEIKIEISGHTDNIGSDAYNLRLSQRRAEAVKQFLVGKGVADERIKTIGYGSKKPIEKNTTSKGRAKNRRIEFLRTQ